MQQDPQEVGFGIAIDTESRCLEPIESQMMHGEKPRAQNDDAPFLTGDEKCKRSKNTEVKLEFTASQLHVPSYRLYLRNGEHTTREHRDRSPYVGSDTQSQEEQHACDAEQAERLVGQADG